MEMSKKRGRGYIAWNDDMDKALLDTFVEHYNRGDKCQNGWKSHVYTAAIKNIHEKCSVDITKTTSCQEARHLTNTTLSSVGCFHLVGLVGTLSKKRYLLIVMLYEKHMFK